MKSKLDTILDRNFKGPISNHIMDFLYKDKKIFIINKREDITPIYHKVYYNIKKGSNLFDIYINVDENQYISLKIVSNKNNLEQKTDSLPQVLLLLGEYIK